MFFRATMVRWTVILLVFLLQTSLGTWKMSKVMKHSLGNNLADEHSLENRKIKAEEERVAAEQEKIKNMETKSVAQLRSELFPVYTTSVPNSEASEILSNEENNWESVGQDKEWDLVFVNNLPIDRRAPDAWRLLKKTRLLVIHDTASFTMKNKMDLSNNGCSWNGWPCYLDISEPTMSTLPFGGIIKKSFWTTLIQGGRDTDGEAFKSVVKAFEDNNDIVNSGYRHYNRKKNDSGTYARLLLTAAMMTRGDILELGCGDLSTKLLHEIAEGDNKKKEWRMIVTADSNPLSLATHKDLGCKFHKLVLVPE